MDAQETRDWEALCELIWGCAIGQAIHVSAELGLFEVLAEGPRSAGSLASAVEADAWVLEAVLRALVAHGVLRREDDRRYALTGMGRLLLRSAPGPSAGEAREFYDTLYRSLGDLMAMVKTGEVAFERTYGKSFYEHLAQRPALAAHFYASMQSNAASRYARLSEVVDFSEVVRAVDVGGGEGSLLAQLLREHPRMKAVLFDLPVVCDRAHATLADAGLLDRCQIVAGDFLDGVPYDGDLYILANVLNNWRDDDARRVLQRCRSAMTAEARLLVLEAVLGNDIPPRWRTLVSLGVMAQRGGRTRTEAQMQDLLASAGFAVEALRPIPGSATVAVTARRDAD